MMDPKETKRERPHWARKQLLINEHFQFRFIAFCGVTTLAACAFFYGATYYFFLKYTHYAIEVGLQKGDPFFKVLMNMQDLITLIFAVTTLATIAFSTLAGLVFSNRVAGPLHRMRMHCEKVARGESLDDLSFRENDYFNEVAEAYNRQMDYVRKQLGRSPNIKKAG